jgi:hypothetical protein
LVDQCEPEPAGGVVAAVPGACPAGEPLEHLFALLGRHAGSNVVDLQASTMRWSDIRDKRVEAIGREDVERGAARPDPASPPSEASSKSSPTSATNSSRSAERSR